MTSEEIIPHPRERVRMAQAVLTWFDDHGRKDLPWQGDTTPYGVWVSEIMLQQTQVATVIDYYNRFIARFPTVHALARADIDAVLHHWSGLGYYARARNLHRAAQSIVAEHGGHLPTERALLESLPGIGRSTAGAILSLGHGQRAAILDGNVKRILARFHAVDGWPGRSETLRRLWQLAETYTPLERADNYNQAMMDIGASVCTRSRPSCPSCPLAYGCVALAAGTQSAYPSPRPRPELPTRSTWMLVVRDPRGAVLLERRPPTGIWGGLWSLPECPSEDEIDTACRRLTGREPASLEMLQPRRHTFTHFRLNITPVQLTLASDCDRIADGDQIRWFDLEQRLPVGLAAPVSRILNELIDPTRGDVL